MGTCIGSFEVIEPISRGATSVVYRGFQASLCRPVAIKQLLPQHLVSPEAVSRFEREAKSIAAFSHPSIAQILDYLVEEKARYIVMEYVTGNDLGRVLEKQGRLGQDEALAIGDRVAEALAFAHSRGIVHRDIKPRNILLSRDGQVKVVDFGIARILHPDERTTTTGFVGTPAYTAPEQILGKRVGPRADIFALGVLLYEMVTGAKPFQTDTEGNVVSKILEEEPIPPRAQHREVSRAFQRVILRCLEKDPARRYASMSDLQVAIRAAMSRGERSTSRALPRLAASLFGTDTEDTSTLVPSLPASGWPGRTVRGWQASMLRRFSLFGTVGAVALLGAMLMVFFGHGRQAGAEVASPEGRLGLGYCRVVAYPWAEVYVDDTRHGTTPFDRALGLPAGEHRVRLSHPDLPDYETIIVVEPGSFQRLRVDLTGGGRFEEASRR